MVVRAVDGIVIRGPHDTTYKKRGRREATILPTPKLVTTPRVQASYEDLKKKDILDLVSMAKDGDNDAWKILLESTYPFIQLKAKHFGNELDFEPAGIEGFLQVIQRTDLTRDHENYKGYLIRAIVNHMKEYQRRSLKHTHAPLSEHFHGRSQSYLEDNIKDLQELHEVGIIDKILGVDSLEKKIIELSLGVNWGFNTKHKLFTKQSEIVSELGISERSVRRHTKNALNKINLAIQLLNEKGHLEQFDIYKIQSISHDATTKHQSAKTVLAV